jgi:hypothetical protein
MLLLAQDLEKKTFKHEGAFLGIEQVMMEKVA